MNYEAMVRAAEKIVASAEKKRARADAWTVLAKDIQEVLDRHSVQTQPDAFLDDGLDISVTVEDLKRALVEKVA